MDKMFLFLAGNNTNFKSKKEMASCAGVGLISLALLFNHIVFFIFFFINNSYTMLLINAVSICLYILSIALNRITQGIASSALLTFEICAYCIASTVIVGWQSQTHIYLPAMLIPCFILYPISKKIGWIHAFTISLSLISCFLINIYITPLEQFANMPVLSFLNIISCVIGALLFFECISFGNKLTEVFYKEKMEDLFNDAHKDQLTRLWNRRYALSKMNEFLHTFDLDSRLCVAICDIDDFKRLNDTYGHNLGDNALCALSDVMTKTFRSSDILVRWGGEEFLIIMPNTLRDNAKRVLEIFRKSVESLIIFGDDSENVKFTITIGFSEVNSGMSIEEAVNKADRALYYGKENFKNRVIDFNYIQ